MELTDNVGISKAAGEVVDANFTRLGHQILTDAATIAMDCALGCNAKVTLAGNRTMGAPTNAVAGDGGRITFIQDATGSRTLAWNAAWKHAGGTDLVLTTTAAAVDTVEWYTPDGTTFHIVGSSLALAS